MDALTSDPTRITAVGVNIATTIIEQFMVFAIGNASVSPYNHIYDMHNAIFHA